MKAEFEPQARQELIETTRRYLAEAGAIHASAFESEVTRTLALLARFPELGTHGTGILVRSRCGAILAPCTISLSPI